MPVRLPYQERFSRNVLPRQPMDGFVHGCPDDAALCRNVVNVGTRRMKPTAFSDKNIGQFRSWFSLAMSVPPLANHVGHVLLVRPQEQVGRVDASRIVTTGTVVADKEAVRDGADVNFPGDTRSPAVSMLLGADLAIPGLINVPCPEPTPVCFVHLAPEAASDVLTTVLPPASVTAKTALSYVNPGWKGEEERSAHPARNLNLRARSFSDRMILHRKPRCFWCQGQAVTSSAAPFSCHSIGSALGGKS